jgi:probable 2-oxoglutarate dehydrogenase E1 component DHKTD1
MVEGFESRQLDTDDKLKIFGLLTRSEVFDHFMTKRFTQVKRYGLEGAESVMVSLNALFRESSAGIIFLLSLCLDIYN